MRQMLPARDPGARPKGQSLVEFALVLPMIMLLLLIAVDFGRVYLGWVNLTNAVREAANYAALNPRGWTGGGDSAIQDRFASLIADETSSINCTPDSVEPPTLTSGAVLGGSAIVTIDCQFSPLTPFVSSIVGDDLTVTASANFPIRTGAIASLPSSGGGGGGGVIPIANFTGDQLVGVAPLTVAFTDTSANLPTSWSWTFAPGVTRTGSTAADQHPSYTYTVPGDYTVTLVATNVNGSDTEAKVAYIKVTEPANGPVADFTFLPAGGTAPLLVTFTVTDLITGNPTAWAWTFGDGATADIQSPSNRYTSDGTFTIGLTVTNDLGESDYKEKTLIVDRPICTVPNLVGAQKSAATGIWTTAGFESANISFKPPKPNGPADYEIKKQSLVGGQVDPQPLGCGSLIEVGP